MSDEPERRRPDCACEARMTEARQNDCRNCAARLDGMVATYCWHTAFELSHPGCGRVNPLYGTRAGSGRAPEWCPGMVREPRQDRDA